MRSLGRELLRSARSTVAEPLTELEPRLRRAAGRVWAWWVLRGAERGYHATVMGPLEVDNRGTLSVGPHVYFLPGVLPTRLRVDPDALLTVGRSCGFASGATVRVHHKVTFGSGCLVAAQVHIEDAPGAPITIEDEVWLAHGARIEPGVTIGRGSAVSAGTVVTKDVPPGHLAIGAPARNVKLETLDRAAAR